MTSSFLKGLISGFGKQNKSSWVQFKVSFANDRISTSQASMKHFKNSVIFGRNFLNYFFTGKNINVWDGEFNLCHFWCHIFISIVLQCKHRQRKICRIVRTHWAFFQPGVKNELFNSKEAFSWPFVCFDLGIRSLHECLYCHFMLPRFVIYWK